MAAMTPIVDGFVYNFNYRMLCGYYPTVILEQLRAIRKTNNYQQRLYVIPGSATDVVPAYGTYEYQLQVTPGSVFWAYSFYDSTGLYTFNIFDPCTGRSSSDGIKGSGTSPTLWEGQIILPTLYYVPARGLLNVEIGTTNTVASTPGTFQLIIYALNPVESDCVKL
jgi:hypothetical protein